jgi:hypothetical protein
VAEAAMNEIESERAALEKANRDLDDADERIRRQEQIASEMERDGHVAAAATARQLLQVMRGTRTAMQSHRDLIIANLARLGRREP